MRKIITTIAIAILTLTTFSVNAQEKGNKYVGGNIGFGVSYISGLGSANISIAPEFGYFVKNNIKVGAELAYGYSEGIHALLVTPNITYYHRFFDKLYYTPGIGLSGGLATFDGSTAGAFALSINLASVEYKPTEKIGISLSLVNLNYAHLGGLNIVNFNLMTSPYVGFHYYL